MKEFYTTLLYVAQGVTMGAAVASRSLQPYIYGGIVVALIIAAICLIDLRQESNKLKALEKSLLSQLIPVVAIALCFTSWAMLYSLFNIAFPHTNVIGIILAMTPITVIQFAALRIGYAPFKNYIRTL